jgi:tRNA-Thr(GGU) m(6)t(6)A37 methyltransferase TsaA
MGRQEGKVRFIGIIEKSGRSKNKIRIYPEFCEGLKGIEHCKNVIVLYWFHLRDDAKNRNTLRVFPKRRPGTKETGVFASRSSSRPNPLGLCTVKLLSVRGCVLTVSRLDALPETPIVDIKPYHPEDSAANEENRPT